MTNIKISKWLIAKLVLIVSCLCAGFLPATAQPAEKAAIDYFYEGKNLVEKIYAARTGTELGSYALIEQRRRTFELSYNEPIIKKLDGAIADLEKAKSLAASEAIKKIAEGDGKSAESVKVIERNSAEYLALAYLEKAQFVTNKLADFGKVTSNFDERARNDRYYDAPNSWMKNGYLIAAELRALVAQDKIEQALKLYGGWRTIVYPNKNYEFLKKEIALPSIAEAFDLTGNFNYTRAVLLATAYEQIQRDGGNFIPANHAVTKQTAKNHQLNLGYAFQIPESGNLLPLQRARNAGALYLEGNPSAAAKQFIIDSPAVISSAPGQITPLETKIYAARLALQSANAGEKAKGLSLINGILQQDAANVPALAARGYANYLKGDFAAAEIDLSAAIKANIFLAFFNDALATRVLVYQKLGKAELAANDEKQATTLKQIFGIIVAP